MKLNLVKKNADEVKDDLLAFLVFQGESFPKEAEPFVKDLSKKQFEAKEGQSYHTSTLGKAKFKSVLLIGLGKKEDFIKDMLRRAAAAVVKKCTALKIKSASIALNKLGKNEAGESIAAIAEGAILSSYKFTKYKSEKDDFEMEKLSIATKDHSDETKALEMATIMAESQNYSRMIDEEPANIMTPSRVAEEAKKLSKETKLSLTVFDKKRLEKSKMNGILAVGQGSGEEPKLIILEHNKGNKKLPLYAVVGKGVTFDSGGISIKPSKNMHEMKYDKSGAILVLGIMRAAAKLDLPIRLVGLMPCVENMPSQNAQRPGDIIKMYNGKTVEVINTDAEGRLILADSLAYAAKMKPVAMIDLATLTGAMVVALGSHAIGCFSNDDALSKTLDCAGAGTHERVWRMPAWDEYGKMMEADFADLKNLSGTGEAGSITAAMFLKNFVDDRSWAHLDVAGVSWLNRDHPYLSKGATGIGVRLVVKALSELSK
jgi:leucyl aminopeptidase